MLQQSDYTSHNRLLRKVRSQGNNLKIKVNDILVSYNDWGPADQPTIIFIHGFPFNKWMWSSQVESMRKNYRVISYDIRGYGDTEPGEQTFSMELFVSDLVGLIDALALQNVMLCGLSMGGYIALRAIEMHPERFDALVLSDTQCDADNEITKEKRLASIETIKEKGLEFYADETIKKLFAQESFENRKDEIKAIREMILTTSKQSLYRTLTALAMRKETCSRLSSIKIPVLVIVGEKDAITPPEKANYLHENIHRSVLHFVEHAGHVANMENAEAFNTSLRKFAHRFAG